MLEKRIRILSELAKDWRVRSRKIRSLVLKLDIPLITYETFCQSPSLVVSKLRLPDGVSDTINTEAKVKVKDYKFQRISNQNQRQIRNLGDKEVECITNVLKNDKELLEFLATSVVS